ncbi:Transcriptional regulator, TetR family [Microbacterium esteraromaticum]|uniref:Transcriptional regulator, TetR family n=1 Tax=Microbacterium esteraromaticum TaxID=57043 RepID=A0A1R4K399_9MICO|nr:TetR family transcriptional regulator [Microbacterium esteraromaticum]SJN38493.1 Transcriptional regulator, TetR family [Microbacterium esteraromaticum]
MRSVSDDLTARARIRDAAIQSFARDGFDATSMRAIAKDAGVSAALIVHHFGDKNALRDACDEYVVAAFIDDKHELIEAPTADRIRAALHDIERYGPYIDYLGRMLGDSSPAANRLFDKLIDVTRETLDQQRAAGLLVEMSDPEMTTMLIAMMGLAPVMMRAQISRVLGEDQLSPAGMMRTTLPTLELVTHGIYSTSVFLDGAREALSGEQAATQKVEAAEEGAPS